eukprot:936536-Prymnesium_polylepis.1
MTAATSATAATTAGPVPPGLALPLRPPTAPPLPSPPPPLRPATWRGPSHSMSGDGRKRSATHGAAGGRSLGGAAAVAAQDAASGAQHK